jgi:DNA-binding winged helix-turn-helix (wHTH) protein
MTESYAFSGFVLDCDAGTLAYGDTPIRLTAKSLAVLELLVRRAPATVSRADFEAVIWPEGYIEPANLTQTIYMIRKAAAPYAQAQLIETLNARGYRLATRPVRIAEPSGEAAHAQRPSDGAQRNVLARIATSIALAAGLAYAAALVGGDRLPKPGSGPNSEARQNERAPAHLVHRSG